jgi:hypothetical protein
MIVFDGRHYKDAVSMSMLEAAWKAIEKNQSDVRHVVIMDFYDRDSLKRIQGLRELRLCRLETFKYVPPAFKKQMKYF